MIGKIWAIAHMKSTVKGVTSMIQKLLVVLVGVVALGLAGCETVKGAGKDIQSGGEAISDGSQATSDAISGN